MNGCQWAGPAMGYDDSGMPLLTPLAPARDSDDLERHLSKRDFPHRLASLKTGLLRYLMSRRVIAAQVELDDVELDWEPRAASQKTSLEETKVA